MKSLHLTLLGSNTVIQAARRPSFTCVMRCYTSSPKGKIQNLIRSNSVAGAYLPACCFSNPNLHRLLILGQLSTPVLPKGISLIFPWVEFSRRASISIVNLLVKTVSVFGGRWGAHSYSDSPKYNKIKNNLLNLLPILVLNC